MKRKSILVMVFMLMITMAGCGDSETNQPQEENIASEESAIIFESLSERDDLKISPATDSGDSEAVTPKDIIKYNEILDYLSSDWNRPENELLAEYAKIHNENPEDLKVFIDKVMPCATGLEEMPDAITPTFQQLLYYTEIALETALEKDVAVTTDENKWTWEATGYRYLMKCETVEIDKEILPVIVKLEFSPDFSICRTIQIKVDLKNIELN